MNIKSVFDEYGQDFRPQANAILRPNTIPAGILPIQGTFLDNKNVINLEIRLPA